MEWALIGTGAAIVILVLVVGYIFVSDPERVDEEELEEVRRETPKEHTEALASEHHKTLQEEQQKQEELYEHDE